MQFAEAIARKIFECLIIAIQQYQSAQIKKTTARVENRELILPKKRTIKQWRILRGDGATAPQNHIELTAIRTQLGGPTAKISPAQKSKIQMRINKIIRRLPKIKSRTTPWRAKSTGNSLAPQCTLIDKNSPPPSRNF
jgi:hypothetical protein